MGFDGCGREPHPDFKRLLVEFNRSQGTPLVYVRWNPTARLVHFAHYKRDGMGRKGMVVHGVYTPAWEVGVVLDGLPPGYHTQGEYIGNDRWFFKVFDWDRDLDESVFEHLHLTDTASGRTRASPLERIEAREKLKELEVKKQARLQSEALNDYYRSYDNPIVGAAAGSGDWRHRIR